MAGGAAAGGDRFAGTGRPQRAGGRERLRRPTRGLMPWPLRRRCCPCRRAPSSRPAGCAIGRWRRERGSRAIWTNIIAVFHDAWKGPPVAAPAAAADGTGWPLEQCAYWLNGLVELGFVLHDDALVQKATRAIDVGGRRGESWRNLLDLLEEGQAAGIQPLGPVADGPALVAWYAATGQQRILDALVRAYADCPVPMGPLHMDGSAEGGLCNLDAMVETYCLQRRSSHRGADPRRRRSSGRSPRPSGTGSPAVSCRTMRWG